MTHTHSADNAIIEILQFLGENWKVGGSVIGGDTASVFQPRQIKHSEWECAPREAVEAINLKLKQIPLRDIVRASLKIDDQSIPADMQLNRKIPFRVDSFSESYSLRLQWTPKGPLYILDEDGPQIPGSLNIRVITK